MVDPKIYDAPELDPIVSESGSAIKPWTAEKVSVGVPLSNNRHQPQAAAMNIEATRERAGPVAAYGAATSEGSIRSLYEFVAGPTYAVDPQFKPHEAVQGVPFELSDEERKFLMDSASQEEYAHKLSTVQRQRKAYEAIGDNKLAGFLGMMTDVPYLVVGAASGGVGWGARALGASRAIQRTATGLAAVGTEYGMGKFEQQFRPMSETEVVVGALVNGAASAVLFTPRGRVPADPEFPSIQLHESATTMRVRNPDAANTVLHEFRAPAGQMRTGAELVQHLRTRLGQEYTELLDAIGASPNLSRIKVSTDPALQSIRPKARGWYDHKQGLVYLREDVGLDTAVHELVHGTIEKQIMATPRLANEVAGIIKNVRKEFRTEGGAPNQNNRLFWDTVFDKPEEFLAYATTSPEFRKWAKSVRLDESGVAQLQDAAPALPDAPPALTLWDKVVDVVARALGMEGSKAAAVRKYLDTVKAQPVYKSLDDRLKEMMYESMPQGPLFRKGILSGVQASDSAVEVRKAVVRNEDKAAVLGDKISWSLHKSLASFSAKAREVADILVDDPLNPVNDTVVGHARSIRADLAAYQYRYENMLAKEMARQGFGLRQRILKPREALEAQRKLEREVALELLDRQRSARLGSPRPSAARPEVKAIADKLDELYAAALQEQKAAGVLGAEAVEASTGYFQRRWDVANIDKARERLMQQGMDKAAADSELRRIVQQGLRRANGWDAELAGDVAKAILDRAHRKGYFEDAAFRHHAGLDAVKEVRDILTDSGISGARLDRAIEVLTGKVDEAGKLSTLKHRVDIDTKAGIALADGSSLTIADLISTDLTRMTDEYLDAAAGRSALARKGLVSSSDIDTMRTEFLESIPDVAARKQAVNLFDQTMNSLMGRPTGEDLPEAMRNLQAVTRMVGLASSGLWQATEYAVMMQRFGGMRVLKAAMKSNPFKELRASIRHDVENSRNLVDILTRNSSADVRIRPYLNRLEDNFEVAPGAIVQSALMQAQQLVPYVNGQKFVQVHQARVAANCMVDVLHKAGKGDQKAINLLAEYGIEGHTMSKIAGELAEAGLDTAKWSDGVWEQVRVPLQRMMDEAVLRNRTGEIPAFAQFTSVGKFVFTFRSFVLGAHNKVLAGTMSRDGFAGLSLLMLYQYPMVLLATQANAAIQGKDLTDQELLTKAFGQMSSLGLASELFGIITGEKQQFGAPGLIAIDRMYKVAGEVFSGDAGGAVNGAILAAPIISILPGARAIGEAFKE